MARKERMRYWKITAEETDSFSYDESKLLNWEIKCIREPEEEAHFIGVFMYRNGTAYDYESVKGICYFYITILTEKNSQRLLNFYKESIMVKKWKKEIE